MRTKAVPEPVSKEALTSAQSAVPLVPDPTVDCCARLQARGPASARESAQDWLAFLAALELVTESERGYERRRFDPETEPLEERYREEIFGVEELCADLASGPRTPPEAFEALRPTVPTWERERHTDWEREWLERTTRLLSWGVVFGLFERRNDAYAVR